MLKKNVSSILFTIAGLCFIGLSIYCIRLQSVYYALAFLSCGNALLVFGLIGVVKMSSKFRIGKAKGNRFNRNWWIDRYHDNPHNARVDVLRFRALLTAVITGLMFNNISWQFESVPIVSTPMRFIAYMCILMSAIMLPIWIMTQLEFRSFMKRKNQDID